MIVDATDPDLAAFKARGGKLLSYFGWADPDINPLTLIEYRNEVASLDAQVDEYFRVFMIPGMFHCRGGAGPDRFDAMTPLIEWVETDRGPEQLELWRQSDSATGKADRSLACPYPQAVDRRSDSPRCRVPGDMAR
jgi:feruloyl esterase